MRRLLRMYTLPALKNMLQQHSMGVIITDLARLLVRLKRNHPKSRARNANETDQRAKVMLLSNLGSISNGCCTTGRENCPA